MASESETPGATEGEPEPSRSAPDAECSTPSAGAPPPPAWRPEWKRKSERRAEAVRARQDAGVVASPDIWWCPQGPAGGGVPTVGTSAKPRKRGPAKHQLSPAEAEEIAARRHGGQSQVGIAADMGRAIMTIRQEIESGRHKSLLAALTDRHLEQLGEAFREAIQSARHDLTIPETCWQARGEARKWVLEALEREARIRGALPVAGEQAQGQGQYTLTELLTVLRRVEVRPGETA